MVSVALIIISNETQNYFVYGLYNLTWCHGFITSGLHALQKTFTFYFISPSSNTNCLGTISKFGCIFEDM